MCWRDMASSPRYWHGKLFAITFRGCLVGVTCKNPKGQLGRKQDFARSFVGEGVIVQRANWASFVPMMQYSWSRSLEARELSLPELMINTQERIHSVTELGLDSEW